MAIRKNEAIIPDMFDKKITKKNKFLPKIFLPLHRVPLNPTLHVQVKPSKLGEQVP